MRIPYTPDPPAFAGDSAEAAEARAVAARVAARRAPRPLQPLDLALLHAPPVADGWNAFLGAVRGRTAALDAALRELLICRVAVCNRAWYEWGHHAPLAAAAGVPAAALEGVVGRPGALLLLGGQDGGGGEEWRTQGLSEKQWVGLCYADEMTRNVAVGDHTFEALRALCAGEREVVEITATVAAYNCVSRFLVALDVGEKNNTGPDAPVSH